ncbi:MAG TPA: TRAP transporter small permease [Deltaproteobacteria bacterium]|nr:TRAP transporter small permease [Deltaproteobacteria bacterium]
MIDRLAKGVLAVAGVAIVFMIGVTFLDVILSKVFHSPLRGAYEFVALAQVVAISLSGARAFLSGRHVQVEIFVAKLPPRARRAVIVFVSFLGTVLFAVVAWEGFLYGESLRVAGEVTGTTRIPLFPFAHALGLSGLLMFFLLGRELVRSLRGRL